ncbi:hypothetical protein MGN70_012360 [Eutypa lata]|nr:hypothetical protein MGN70_012360 [Eutypa lata]
MKYWGMEWHDDILDLHKKYGRIVRVAPNELSVVHPDGLKQLFSFRSNTEKTEWYHTWEILAGVEVPSLFPGQDKKVHSFLRKRVAAAYSMSTVLRTEKHIQSCMDLLWRQLKKHADTGHPVDMSNWTSYLAYDVVGELAFGEKFGSLESETDVMDLVKNSLGVNFMIANIGHYPGQAWLVKNWVFETVMKWCGNKSPIEDFFTWTSRAVQDRMSDKALSKRHDMLSYFIDMKDVNGNPANFREILLETHNIVGAGADTTSIGLRAALYFTCTRPIVYAKLQAEIDQYYDTRGLSGHITYTQTQELPYLKAVVKEALRLFPSISYQLLRKAPENMVIDGNVIPAGASVGISPRAQNRDPAVWGEDAEEFRPERWLEDPSKVSRMDEMSMTFGGNGPRVCMGKNIALVEIFLFLAQLLRNFNLEFASPDKPWRVETYWLSFQFDMLMYLTKRECMNLKDVD